MKMKKIVGRITMGALLCRYEGARGAAALWEASASFQGDEWMCVCARACVFSLGFVDEFRSCVVLSRGDFF